MLPKQTSVLTANVVGISGQDLPATTSINLVAGYATLTHLSFAFALKFLQSPRN